MMFNTILVATDGSDHAGKAIELASDLAEKYGAQLILLHVLLRGRLSDELRHMAEVEHLVAPASPTQPNVENTPATMAAALGSAQNSGQQLQRILEATGKMIVDAGERIAKCKGVERITTIVDDGNAAQRILERAEQENADLIVLGSRGLGDLKGLLLGSVSHKVSQLAKCTCVTVK